MTWIDSRSFGEKIIKIVSDNRVMPSEWKYAIPLYIVQQPIPIVLNAKFLAEGILEGIELYHPDIDKYAPPHDRYVQESLF